MDAPVPESGAPAGDAVAGAPRRGWLRAALPHAITAVVAVTACFTTFAAHADGAALSTKYNCQACHAVDKKLVGPYYKEVAQKYAGQKDAVDKLAVKIQKGGAGVWGPVPMPANPQVSDAEAKKLAAWVLTQK